MSVAMAPLEINYYEMASKQQVKDWYNSSLLKENSDLSFDGSSYLYVTCRVSLLTRKPDNAPVFSLS